MPENIFVFIVIFTKPDKSVTSTALFVDWLIDWFISIPHPAIVPPQLPPPLFFLRKRNLVLFFVTGIPSSTPTYDKRENSCKKIWLIINKIIKIIIILIITSLSTDSNWSSILFKDFRFCSTCLISEAAESNCEHQPFKRTFGVQFLIDSTGDITV